MDDLDSTFLADFLRRQRWFAGKVRDLLGVRIVDRAAVPGAVPPVVLALVDVEYAEGPAERYFVPLVEESPSPGGAEPQLGIDALRNAEACRAIFEALVLRGQPLATSAGALIRLARTPAWPGAAAGPEEEPVRIRISGDEQTNSAFLVGDRFFLKLFRRLEDGLNPEAEIGRFLASRTDYGRSPRLYGALEYERPDAATATLGVLQESLGECENAWAFTLEELARFRERSRALPEAAAGDAARRSVVREAAREYLQVAADLGRATAELHLALASGDGDPAFRPMKVARADLVTWSASIAARAERNLALLQSSLGGLPRDAVPDARRALARAPEIGAKLRALQDLRTEGVRRIRCHGDYHLGQVLRRRSDGGLFIIDFEGEPERPIEERRTRMPAFKDVAGMLRSFSYAVSAARDSRAASEDRRESWMAVWESAVTTEFLKSYWKIASKGRFLPDDEKTFRCWTELFLLEKAVYEIGYELNHRPGWIVIPISGLVSILDG